MTTQQAKEHKVGEWADIRNTSSEIAEAIFEAAEYDEKTAQAIWQNEKRDQTVLTLAFSKTKEDVLQWNGVPVERQNV